MSGSDATVMVAGQLLDIVDDEWRADTLPFDGESPSRYHETRPDLTSRSIPPLPRFARRVIALTPARPVPNPQRYPCPRA
jgi:hypothetical protein